MVKINSRATSQYKIQLDVRICKKHDKAKRRKKITRIGGVLGFSIGKGSATFSLNVGKEERKH